MDPSRPRPKFWFPYVRLTLFFGVFVFSMFTILNFFDPEIERDPKEWATPGVSKKVKQVEWMLKLFKKQQKKK